MERSAIPDLARLVERPFQSFSEATASVLEVLSARMPDVKMLVGGLNYEQGEYRVIDARGEVLPDLQPGFTLPIAESFCVHMADGSAPRLTRDAAHDAVYSGLELQRSWSVHSYVGFPLEMSDGARVGSLCAMTTEAGRFDERDLELLSVAGRMLAYEWERVAREVELQRLRKHRGDPETTDPLTGVTKRQSFLSWLVHEWQAAHQGTVESYLVLFELEGREETVERFGDAMGDLLLKDVARALDGQARRTDIVGRVGGERLAAVLVGCKGEQGAKAFCNRVAMAFKSVTDDRPVEVDLVASAHNLGRLPSADRALELAGQTVRKVPDRQEGVAGAAAGSSGRRAGSARKVSSGLG
jgi:diguanylate cyclase (GGDEF)-like protein